MKKIVVYKKNEVVFDKETNSYSKIIQVLRDTTNNRFFYRLEESDDLSDGE